MLVTDLSSSFNPVPKIKKEQKEKVVKIKNKSKKLAKLERQRFSIVTKDLEHCYLCTKQGIKSIPKDDFHELIEGKNRQTSMKYGLVIPICRKCHEKVTNDKTLQEKLHKVGQKVFEKHYKTENFIKVFGKNYL